jgi:D-glycero-D-manno-heptose 1,7-bisphosphate phosphatase
MAVFIDRDGVINHNRADHVKSWEEFEFLPGVMEALARLTRMGHDVFVITNQAVVNRGVVPREAVEEINRRMVQEIERWGGRVAAVLICPHRPDEGCLCRKPRPGLLIEAQQTYDVDLNESYLIGDFPSDMEAAQKVGCTPILVLTGRGEDALRSLPARRQQEYLVVPDLQHAVDLIEPRERLKNRMMSPGETAAS